MMNKAEYVSFWSNNELEVSSTVFFVGVKAQLKENRAKRKKENSVGFGDQDKAILEGV